MTRIQIAGALAALLLAALSLVASARFDPEIPFLASSPDAEWITWDRPVGLETLLAGRPIAVAATFERSFTLAAPPARATLRAEALGDLRVMVNERPLAIPSADRACFKSACEIGLADALRVGENTLRAEVLNPSGPQLLRLWVDGLPEGVATDARWRVALGDAPAAPAVVADDTRPFDESRATKTAGRALRERAPWVAALFLASALAYLLGRRRLPEAARRRLPELALAAVTLFWVFLFAARFVQLPPHWGYDAKFHAEYVHHLVDRQTLPLASDGFSMYHPPLFYGLAAAVVATAEPVRGSVGEQAALKLVPLLCGLGMVWLACGLLRRLFPDDPLPALFGVVFAGTLPVNLYMSAYVSNEPLFALLTAAALAISAPLLLEREKSPLRLAALSGVLGLGLATKYTALVTAPVFVFLLGFELVLAERERVRRAALVCGGVLLGALCIGGWVYLRNWIHFRDPLIWNLDVPGALIWWQTPGFRTLDYYLGFGEALVHPFFSLFHSFWDGLYSTFWGDGAPPSIYHLAERHTLWNYAAMTSGYLLALPATAILGIGAVRVLREAFSGNDLRRRSFYTLVAALLFVMLFSVVSLSLRFPFWGAIRASYVLAAVVPAAICAGIGGARAHGWLEARFGPVACALYYGWLAAFVGTLVAAFAG